MSPKSKIYKLNKPKMLERHQSKAKMSSDIGPKKCFCNNAVTNAIIISEVWGFYQKKPLKAILGIERKR